MAHCDFVACVCKHLFSFCLIIFIHAYVWRKSCDKEMAIYLCLAALSKQKLHNKKNHNNVIIHKRRVTKVKDTKKYEKKQKTIKFLLTTNRENIFLFNIFVGWLILLDFFLFHQSSFIIYKEIEQLN